MPKQPNDDERYNIANIPSYLLRGLIAALMEFGMDSARLCQVVGITVDDLFDPACRISFPLSTYDPLIHRQALEFVKMSFSRERENLALFESDERVVQHSLKSLATSAEIAQKLCLSRRTLRRRLADKGVTYQSLLDVVRKRCTLEMQENPTLSIEQIAQEVGFSDSHNFRRAFKRWTGNTPSEMR